MTRIGICLLESEGERSRFTPGGDGAARRLLADIVGQGWRLTEVVVAVVADRPHRELELTIALGARRGVRVKLSDRDPLRIAAALGQEMLAARASLVLLGGFPDDSMNAIVAPALAECVAATFVGDVRHVSLDPHAGVKVVHANDRHLRVTSSVVLAASERLVAPPTPSFAALDAAASVPIVVRRYGGGEPRSLPSEVRRRDRRAQLLPDDPGRAARAMLTTIAAVRS